MISAPMPCCEPIHSPIVASLSVASCRPRRESVRRRRDRRHAERDLVDVGLLQKIEHVYDATVSHRGIRLDDGPQVRVLRLRVARQLGPGHTVVTMVCDTGSKYLSRLFNREWLAQKGLLEAAGLAAAPP